MNTKYMDFVLSGMSASGKTAVFFVYSKHGDLLGQVRWMGRWRQYSLYLDDKVFSKGCLKDIEDFIAELMEARKSK
jgi:hypothetical protein